MNKILKLGLLLAFVVGALGSCNSNDNDRLFYSYVTVVNPTNATDLTFRTDGGTFLHVRNSSVNTSTLALDDRLIVYYRIRGNSNTTDTNLDIDLRTYYVVLTKDPILQSTLDETEDAELGANAVRVNAAWFGGLYLNVNFSLHRNVNSTVVHTINLVADDEAFELDGTTMNVYLRHNAFADIPTVTSQAFIRTGLVSFDIQNLIDVLDITSDPTFVLHWSEYNGTQWNQPLVERQVTIGKFREWTQDRLLTGAMVDDITEKVM